MTNTEHTAYPGTVEHAEARCRSAETVCDELHEAIASLRKSLADSAAEIATLRTERDEARDRAADLVDALGPDRVWSRGMRELLGAGHGESIGEAAARVVAERDAMTREAFDAAIAGARHKERASLVTFARSVSKAMSAWASDEDGETHLEAYDVHAEARRLGGFEPCTHARMSIHDPCDTCAGFFRFLPPVSDVIPRFIAEERIASARVDGWRQAHYAIANWTYVTDERLFRTAGEPPADWPTPPNPYAALASALSCEASEEGILGAMEAMRSDVESRQDIIDAISGHVAPFRVRAETPELANIVRIVARDLTLTLKLVERVTSERDAKDDEISVLKAEIESLRPRAFPAELRREIEATDREHPTVRGGFVGTIRRVAAWLTSTDVPSEAPRVGPAITREDARIYTTAPGALNRSLGEAHDRIMEALRAYADSEPAPVGSAITDEELEAHHRAACRTGAESIAESFDEEPAPTETVPKTLRDRARAWIEWYRDLESSEPPREETTDILRDLANAPIASEWDEAIEAARFVASSAPMPVLAGVGAISGIRRIDDIQTGLDKLKRGAK